MTNTKEALEQIVKDFLDETDHVLEVADNAPLDDPDYFDRPMQEALAKLNDLILLERIKELETSFLQDPIWAKHSGVSGFVKDRIKALNKEVGNGYIHNYDTK